MHISASDQVFSTLLPIALPPIISSRAQNRSKIISGSDIRARSVTLILRGVLVCQPEMGVLRVHSIIASRSSACDSYDQRMFKQAGWCIQQVTVQNVYKYSHLPPCLHGFFFSFPALSGCKHCLTSLGQKALITIVPCCPHRQLLSYVTNRVKWWGVSRSPLG